VIHYLSYLYVCVLALEDHTPIPVEGFVNRLMVMRTNDNQLFLEEFGSIPMTTSSMPSDVANLPGNKPKNRYYNIVPYDATRVKVKGQGSDYINASYCSVSLCGCLLSWQHWEVYSLFQFVSVYKEYNLLN